MLQSGSEVNSDNEESRPSDQNTNNTTNETSEISIIPDSIQTSQSSDINVKGISIIIKI